MRICQRGWLLGDGRAYLGQLLGLIRVLLIPRVVFGGHRPMVRRSARSPPSSTRVLACAGSDYQLANCSVNLDYRR
jgi:hypothetical protein